MLEPCVNTCSHLNSVVRVRCLTTSSTVAALLTISNSARERMRLVRSWLTYGNVASVLCNFVSQPVQVMPDTLRTTCSLYTLPLSISGSSNLLGCNANALTLVSVLFPLEQQPDLLVVFEPHPEGMFCNAGRGAKQSFGVDFEYRVTVAVPSEQQPSKAATSDGARFAQQPSTSTLFRLFLVTGGVSLDEAEEQRGSG